MPTRTLSLSVFDYVIFISTLAFSTLIGVYYGCFGTKQATIKEYLLGGKKMKIIPIAISVAISHISGTMLIGTVADVYRYGSAIWCFVVTVIIMAILAIFIYLPVFFKLQLDNIYEYLERRFDKKTRMLAFVLYLLSEIMMFPVVAYPPSLTFATASGLNPSLSACLMCIICVFYTAIGGLKTVVWTDFLQFAVIIVSLLTIYVIGLVSSGGFLSIWSDAWQAQRLQVFNFNFDFTERDSFWGYVAFGPTAAGAIVVHQTGVQKFLSLPTYRDCIWSIVYTAISMSLVHTFCVLIGLVVYSRYKNCDPLTGHMIRKHDQIFPYYITEIGERLPGVPGLFIAAVCSAALSSMSSNLNSLAGVIYKDIVCRFLKNKPSEKRGSDILKIIVVVVGLLCTFLVFAVERMGEVFTISALVWGFTQGPILGIFTLGILFPQANHNGALYGAILGSLCVAGISIPNKYYQMMGLLKFPTKPLSTSGCDVANQTLSVVTSLNTTLGPRVTSQPHAIFKTIFFYYAFIGVVTTVIFGLIISFFTKSSSSPVDKELLSPAIYPCLPKSQSEQATLPYNSVEDALEILNHGK